MISNLAIRRPVTTGMFFIAIGMLGVVSLGRLSVELMPEVVFPEIFGPEQVHVEFLSNPEARDLYETRAGEKSAL